MSRCSTTTEEPNVVSPDDLSRVLVILQSQVKTLQRARLQDQAIIRRLKDSGHHREHHHRHSEAKEEDAPALATTDTIKVLELERESLAQLQTQISELKEHLVEVINNKERDSRAWLTIGELRNEQEALRSELTKLRKEMVERPSALADDDSNALKHLKTTQVATKWLQKTVEELRSEMSELARSVNVSASFRQSQLVENNLTFVHTDLRSVRSEVEELRAGETKQEAELEQLKLEAKDIGSIVRILSKKHEDMANEVRSIQNDYSDRSKEHHDSDSLIRANVKLLNDELIGEPDGSGDDEDGDVDASGLTERDIRRSRHRRRMKMEVTQLRRLIISCQKRQKNVDKELKSAVRAFDSINHTMAIVWGELSRLRNNSRFDSEAQNNLMEELYDLRDRLTNAEETIETNSKFLGSVNETASTINMLHDSSVKLFRAVESVEEEYGKTIADMRKEVSKCDFNLAQIQSSNRVLREDLTSQAENERILSRKMDVIRFEVERDHYRLLALQNQALNQSLTECRKTNENALSALKITSLEYSVSQIQSKFLDHQNELKKVNNAMKEKADSGVGRQWVASQRDTNETLLILNRRILELQNDSRLLNKYMNMIARKLPRDCSMEGLVETPGFYGSGVYLIHPIMNGTPFFVEVACDINHQGSVSDSWTIVQRRFDGSEDFYRTWEEYRDGFGQASGEYWLGNDLLHAMTTRRNYTLRIDMWDTLGRYKFAEYAHFKVASEEDNYRLSIGSYAGNASNAMEYHGQMGFSTRDRDNDASSTHCAVYYSSGWWYNHCQYVNINGKYNIGLTWYNIESHEWVQLTKVEMKIRHASKL